MTRTLKTGKTIFELPKRFRGGFFLKRSGNDPKDHPNILHNSNGVHIDRLKKVMLESFNESLIGAYDKSSKALANFVHSATGYAATEWYDAENGYDEWHEAGENWAWVKLQKMAFCMASNP